MLQGTEYFMSERIRRAVARKDICLQSPIDDLESFYNVFVWAIMHNEHSQMALSADEKTYRDDLSGVVNSRGHAQNNLRKKLPVAPIVSQLHGIINAWEKTQAELQWKYDFIVRKFPELVTNKTIGQESIPEQVFWKWIWNLIAYEGVQRIVEIIYSYRDELTTYPSFEQK